MFVPRLDQIRRVYEHYVIPHLSTTYNILLFECSPYYLDAVTDRNTCGDSVLVRSTCSAPSLRCHYECSPPPLNASAAVANRRT
jgi:hypothetical protein